MNWAKNDRARAVFVDEVKIREVLEIAIFDILDEIFDSTVGAQFWGDWLDFFPAA